MLITHLLWNAGFLAAVRASVTVYVQQPLGGSTGTAAGAAATYTAAAEFDPTTLTPPPIPSPAPPTQFTIQLQSSSSTVTGLSIPQSGAFYGFSIEFSVINQVRAYNFVHFMFAHNKDVHFQSVGING